MRKASAVFQIPRTREYIETLGVNRSLESGLNKLINIDGGVTTRYRNRLMEYL